MLNKIITDKVEIWANKNADLQEDVEYALYFIQNLWTNGEVTKDVQKDTVNQLSKQLILYKLSTGRFSV